MAQLWSQDQVGKPPEDRNFRIPLIGETAPSFTAETTNGILNFPGDFGKSWKVLFSHPQDFTPVCSTEILELAYLQDEFEKLGVKVAVVSTDPLSTHVQWKKAMESLNLNNRGTVKIKFPIIDDENVAISKEYGMIHPETNSTRSVRGVFIIDPNNIVQAMYFYPMSVGRSTDELLRMVTALETTAASKVMTPVNWKAGNDVLVPYAPGKDLSKTATPPEGYYALAWYMWYKKVN
jgi:peroxiredoxin (alkyl hydroperoxide reductase subunit C)